ncbi:DUF421 domain-containing protein [Pacificimonas flava]|uniref:DUF421 domain-containing protein n=1 Tax=Pacificimonas flava TaxID=1234595 RepID=M2U392_9SPHN|nr:YetF domain-containing protein [Pacificimonas flava]EMD82373.1 hypothetical protein C725_2094 [Pacificimonas flava]EMD83277.1 hypothetical protein C725_1178 [Pacificimonas flava]MBB5279162.1 uncharacterized membrane protein YcaP (DUF421 family) [Pacificimonas flava]MBB5281208.1 uncharacterized membrane protein YcaP (DUF421 family) [Pacificimonas flava]
MESVVRGFAVYLILLLVCRASGRRTLAQMTPFDFVLLLIVAETTQQALLGDDFSITNSVVLIVTLFVVDIGFSYLKRSSPGVAKLLDGQPTLLMHNGAVDHRALRRARVDTADLLVAARSQHGIERLDQIKHAVLETDSGISIIPAERGTGEETDSRSCS